MSRFGDLIPLSGLRHDGRKYDEVRPLRIRLGIHPIADGSCEYCQGLTRVLVTVEGPKQVQCKAWNSSKKKNNAKLQSGVTFAESNKFWMSTWLFFSTSVTTARSLWRILEFFFCKSAVFSEVFENLQKKWFRDIFRAYFLVGRKRENTTKNASERYR